MAYSTVEFYTARSPEPCPCWLQSEPVESHLLASWNNRALLTPRACSTRSLDTVDGLHAARDGLRFSPFSGASRKRRCDWASTFLQSVARYTESRTPNDVSPREPDRHVTPHKGCPSRSLRTGLYPQQE